MSKKLVAVANPTADLFAEVESSAALGVSRVQRAADIVTPPRAAQALPAPNDWSFELIERYHSVICATAQRFGLDTYPNQIGRASCRERVYGLV